MESNTILLAVDRTIWNVVKKEVITAGYRMKQDMFSILITGNWQDIRSIVYQNEQNV